MKIILKLKIKYHQFMINKYTGVNKVKVQKHLSKLMDIPCVTCFK